MQNEAGGIPKWVYAIAISVIVIASAFIFRYDEESIHGRLFRYDRFTRTVELRLGMDEKSFEWTPEPRFKDLQHVRDFMAQWERNRQIDAIEEQNEELRRRQNIQQWENQELKRSVEDLKSRDMQR